MFSFAHAVKGCLQTHRPRRGAGGIARFRLTFAAAADAWKNQIVPTGKARRAVARPRIQPRRTPRPVTMVRTKRPSAWVMR